MTLLPWHSFKHVKVKNNVRGHNDTRFKMLVMTRCARPPILMKPILLSGFQIDRESESDTSPLMNHLKPPTYNFNAHVSYWLKDNIIRSVAFINHISIMPIALFNIFSSYIRPVSAKWWKVSRPKRHDGLSDMIASSIYS